MPVSLCLARIWLHSTSNCEVIRAGGPPVPPPEGGKSGWWQLIWMPSGGQVGALITVSLAPTTSNSPCLHLGGSGSGVWGAEAMVVSLLWQWWQADQWVPAPWQQRQRCASLGWSEEFSFGGSIGLEQYSGIESHLAEAWFSGEFLAMGGSLRAGAAIRFLSQFPLEPVPIDGVRKGIGIEWHIPQGLKVAPYSGTPNLDSLSLGSHQVWKPYKDSYV